MAKQDSERSRRARHDAAFKRLYDFKLMVQDLLQVALPEEESAALDFSTLERLPAEWISDAFQERRADRVWRVRQNDGGSLISLIEFQSSRDARMPLRMDAYANLLRQHLMAHGLLDPGRRWPRLRPIVLYNGVKRWRASTSLGKWAPKGERSAPRFTEPTFTLIDMGRMKVDDLPANNAVTVQIEMHQGALARDPERLRDQLLERMGGAEHEGLRDALLDWFDETVEPDEAWGPSDRKAWRQRFTGMGEFEVMKGHLVWTSAQEVWLEQGIEKGMERGAARGMARARADQRAQLSRQAGRKFGERAAERLASVIREETDAERLTEVGDWIIDCDAEAEFLARLQVGAEGRG